jgi:ATP-binding cassette subfamily B (MDR/TAP) protein 1
MPIVGSVGFVRLVRIYPCCSHFLDTAYTDVMDGSLIFKHVVMLKDKKNQKNHEESAQVACEATGAIRTVASLTREQDCFQEYSRSLEIPMHNATRSGKWSAILYGIAQGTTFWAIALASVLFFKNCLSCFVRIVAWM